MPQKCFALCTLFCLFALGGCADNQIGRPCNSLDQSGGTTGTSGIRFVNPAPDCPTRLCMVTAPPSTITSGATGHTTELAICTTSCDTNDDCATSSDFTSDKTRCTKYVCGVPSVVPGQDNFCCQKLCMCQDDLIPGFNEDNPRGGAHVPRDSSNVPIPSVCTPDKVAKTCQVPK